MSDQHGERVQGVAVPNAEDQNWGGNYRESDVAQIFKDAQPHSWQDMVQYLENHGDAQWHIKPGEAVAMTEDAKKAMHKGDQFSENAQKTFQTMHQYRSADRSEEPAVMKKHNQ